MIYKLLQHRKIQSLILSPPLKKKATRLVSQSGYSFLSKACFFCTSCQGYHYPHDSAGSRLGQQATRGSKNVPVAQLSHATLWHVLTNLPSSLTSAENEGV